jgi:hypothetical protein
LRKKDNPTSDGARFFNEMREKNYRRKLPLLNTQERLRKNLPNPLTPSHTVHSKFRADAAAEAVELSGK